MPPKAAPVAAPVSKGLKISVKATKYIPQISLETKSDDELKSQSNFKIRIISEWLDCCGSTGTFGQGDLTWKDDGSDKQCALYESSFDPFLFTDFRNDTSKIRSFNIKPGIYFLIMKEISENGTVINVPTSFTCIDCSSFLIENSVKYASTESDDNIKIEISVEIDKPLLPMEDILYMEPLLLNIQRLVNHNL